MPDCRLDLQVFEARYLDMVSRCMRGGQSFGVVALDEDSSQMAAYGCEALISDWHQLDNGLLGIEVLGGRCFAVETVVQQNDGLNVAEVRWLERLADAPLTAEHTELALVLEALLLHPQVQSLDLPKKPLSQALLADRLGYLLPLSVAQKSQLLSVLDPTERLALIAQWIEQMQG